MDLCSRIAATTSVLRVWAAGVRQASVILTVLPSLVGALGIAYPTYCLHLLFSLPVCPCSGELRTADGRLAVAIARGSQGHRIGVHAGEAGDRGRALAYGAHSTGDYPTIYFLL